MKTFTQIHEEESNGELQIDADILLYVMAWLNQAKSMPQRKQMIKGACYCLQDVELNPRWNKNIQAGYNFANDVQDNYCFESAANVFTLVSDNFEVDC